MSLLLSRFNTVKLPGLSISLSLLFAFALSQAHSFAQTGPTPDSEKPADARVAPATPADAPNAPAEAKRILGIIPNFRTSPTLHPYVPISSKQKFKLAAQDAFDRGTVVLAAAFAGEGQLTNANRSFGQGAAGYGRYFGTSYADYVIGDYMTEGIYPSLLHQDPRYFRKGTGSGWSRLGYAAGQIFFTHSDYEGSRVFNYSEILGNSTAVAISTAYYPNNRDVGDAISKLGNQLGVDMASNILKEFWPDLQRKLHRKR